MRTALASHQHHVVAFAPGIDHLGDELGRVLQVGIDDHDGVAVGVVEARTHGSFLAEVARKVDHRHARIRIVQRAKNRHRAVLAAIVDVNDFGGCRQAIEHAGEAPVKRLQHGLLVVDGDDD